jgi:hypothetical protein
METGVDWRASYERDYMFERKKLKEAAQTTVTASRAETIMIVQQCKENDSSATIKQPQVAITLCQ